MKLPKQITVLLRRSMPLSILLTCLAAGPVYAACTNPAGAEADLKYNGDYHTYQFCNGTGWITAGQIASSPGAFSSTMGVTTVLGGDDFGNSNLLVANAAILPHAGTIQSLSFYVNTAGGNLRLGIYDATGPGGGPGAKLAETASFTPGTGWATANVITPVTLAAGTYWLAYLPSSDSLHNPYDTAAVEKSYSFTYGTMPATFSASPSTSAWEASLYATFTNPGDCINPGGNERDIKYSGDFHTLQYCNGSTWYPLGTTSGGSGGGGCSNPTRSERDIIYNLDYHVYQYCNGTTWVKFSGAKKVPVPGPDSGYFVMSQSTWNGNLGGTLAAADAKCLTELTTNTGWKGYATANANGQLIGAKVHAFLCGGAGCNNLNASTTYYFANASDSSKGGSSMVTDGSGAGPGDSANWSDATHFGGTYTYWDERASGTTTRWGTTIFSTWYACNSNNDGAHDWDGNNANGGIVAQTNYTDNQRWNLGWATVIPNCTTLQHLVCYVNP